MEINGNDHSAADERHLIPKIIDKQKLPVAHTGGGNNSSPALATRSDVEKQCPTIVFYTGENEDESDLAEFKAQEELRMGKIRKEHDDDGIIIPVEDLVELWKPWRRTLIIKLLGRTLPYRILLRRLIYLWCSKGMIKIIDLAHDYYVVRFTEKHGYDLALNNGPWTIHGCYLTVVKWRPFFIPSKHQLSSLVWVKFLEVPKEFFKDEILMKLGNLVGKAVKIDTVTSRSSRFARVFVEANFLQPLLTSVVLDGHEFVVEYEGLELVCFRCGKSGHRKQDCYSRAVWSGWIPVEEPGPTPERPYGPWMIAKTRRRRKPGKSGWARARRLEDVRGNQIAITPTANPGGSGRDRAKRLENVRGNQAAITPTVNPGSSGRERAKRLEDVHGNQAAITLTVNPGSWGRERTKRGEDVQGNQAAITPTANQDDNENHELCSKFAAL